jgi:hypothetical protein
MLPPRCESTGGEGQQISALPAFGEIDFSVDSLAQTGTPLNLAQVGDCNETSIPADANV